MVNDETIAAGKAYLKTVQKQNLDTRKKVLSLIPCLELPTESTIDENGHVQGLVNKLNKLFTIIVFTRMSRLPPSKNLVLKSEKWMELYHVLLQSKANVWRAQCPLRISIQEAGQNLMRGIIHLLNKYRTSVLIGHDTNINIISQFLGKKYEAPGLPPLEIFPNSGFVFCLYHNCLEIDYIFIGFDHKLHTAQYLKMRVPNELLGNTEFDLVQRFIV